jgi:hypothetical protein
MAFYQSSEYRANPNRPYTHALVIGVGLYGHLPGEAGQSGPPGDEVTRSDLMLKQLSSLPVSARAFVKWLVEQFKNDLAPLGTLELLVSEAAATPFDLPDYGQRLPRLANLQQVEAAFKAWSACCDSHPGNIALFYFSGHGMLVNGDHVLLLEDYGADKSEPFQASINIGKMQQGMESCKAELQCFFIDACSNVSYQALNLTKSAGQSWADAMSPAQEDRQPITLVLKAAMGGERAIGGPGEVSPFTRVLLQFLDARSYTREGDKWVATTNNLIDSAYRIIGSLDIDDSFASSF